MLRSILILSLISFTISLFASDANVRKPDNLSDSQIQGKVESLKTQDALPLAQVIIYSEVSNLVKVTTTDQNGNFIIKDLPLGKYYLCVSYLGYKSEIVDNIMINTTGVSVNIKDLMLESNVFEIEEVTVKADRKNIQLLSTRKN